MALIDSFGYGQGLQSQIKDYADVYKFKLANVAATKQQKERDARWKSIYNQIKLSPDAVLPAQSEEYKKNVADLYHGLEQSRLYDPNAQSGEQDKMLHDFAVNDLAIKNGKAFTEKHFLSVPDKNLTAPTKEFKAELLNPSSSTKKLSQFPNDELGSYVKDVNPSTGQVGAAVQWTVPETTLPHIAEAVFRPEKNTLTQMFQSQGKNQDYINRIVSTIPQTDAQARQIEQQNNLPPNTITSFDTYANLMWNQPDVQHLTAETHRAELVKGNEGKLLYDGQSWKDPQVGQKAFDLFKEDLRKSVPVDIKIQDRLIPKEQRTSSGGGGYSSGGFDYRVTGDTSKQGIINTNQTITIQKSGAANPKINLGTLNGIDVNTRERVNIDVRDATFKNLVKTNDVDGFTQWYATVSVPTIKQSTRTTKGSTITGAEQVSTTETSPQTIGDYLIPLKGDVLNKLFSSFGSAKKEAVEKALGINFGGEEKTVSFEAGGKKSESKFQSFTVKGKTYNIPAEKVAEFKKDMGLQ